MLEIWDVRTGLYVLYIVIRITRGSWKSESCWHIKQRKEKEQSKVAEVKTELKEELKKECTLPTERRKTIIRQATKSSNLYLKVAVVVTFKILRSIHKTHFLFGTVAVETNLKYYVQSTKHTFCLVRLQLRPI